MLAVAITLTCASWLMFRSNPEPIHKDKRMRVWIDALGNNSLDTFTLEREFADMGSDAVSYLIHALERKNSPFDPIYAGIYPKLPSRIRNRLSAPCDAVMVRCNAINVLGFISTNVKPVIPAILEALKDRDARVRLAASGALGSVRRRAERWDSKSAEHDSMAVLQLMETLQDPDPSTRQNAALSIKEFGDAATNAIPSLVRMASTDKGRAREYALVALGEIGQIPPHLAPLIQAAREASDKEVRESDK